MGFMIIGCLHLIRTNGKEYIMIYGECIVIYVRSDDIYLDLLNAGLPSFFLDRSP